MGNWMVKIINKLILRNKEQEKCYEFKFAKQFEDGAVNIFIKVY